MTGALRSSPFHSFAQRAVSIVPVVLMFDLDFKDEMTEPRARTSVVLFVIAIVALIFAYLGVYGLSSALASADLIRPYDTHADPRPRWLAMAWGGQMGFFLLVAWSLRIMSARQLRRIDEMGD